MTLPLWAELAFEGSMNRALQVTSAAQAAAYRSQGYWGGLTLYERFARSVATAGSSAAIRVGKDTVSYEELLRRVDTLTEEFKHANIRKGDVVAVQAGNGLDLPVVHFALNRIGAIFMPMHDSFRIPEIRHLLQSSLAVAAVVPADHQSFDFAEAYAKLLNELPSMQCVFTLPHVSSEYVGLGPLANSKARTPRPESDRSQSGDLAHVMLSSGTTSMPKISLFTSDNLLAMIDGFVGATQMTRADIACAIAPMGTGATGYWMPVLAPLMTAASTVIIERWAPEDAVNRIVEGRCTYATAIPTQILRMLPHLEERTSRDFERFRFFNTAGAPLPREAAKKVEEVMDCAMQQVYGASDGGVPTMGNVKDPREKRLTTVGRVVPGRVCEIRDSSGKPLPAGETGEVCWTTPDKSFGYLNDIDAARAVFDDRGFYKSGDLGVFDDDGYLRIVGRIKDMILRGGRNISPRLIEESLEGHPSVHEVAVAAMPHAELGEQACAFVVLKEGAALDFETMISFLDRQGVAKWQWPERLEILKELPKSAGAKISKKGLTEIVTRKIRAEIGSSSESLKT
jgi:non-ribosomal peptide synthetase component E (peptide arylation enzyme)